VSLVKLLVSCATEAEASAAIAGGADIVDVKNPREGALGASFPWTIRHVREAAPRNVLVSCTLGDLPNFPGSVSLAALGAATTGVDYVKVGIGEVKTRDDAVHLLRSAVRAAKDYNPTVKVVAAGYADAEKTGSLNPLLISRVADEAGADVAMLDTSVKNGDNLFTFLAKPQVKRIVDDAHDRELQVALAGSLRKEHLPDVFALKADIVGLRGAACTNGDRLKGEVTREAVQELVAVVKRLQSEVAVLR
jgi:uncharacterized protein (UPF0264 family)